MQHLFIKLSYRRPDHCSASQAGDIAVFESGSMYDRFATFSLKTCSFTTTARV